MKKGTLSSIILALTLVTGLVMATLPVAGQSILITIDQYHPNAVTFTATGNFATADDSSQLELFGVDLTGYFSGVPDSGGALPGSLTPAGTSSPFDSWAGDDYFGAGTNVDLNFYSSTSSDTETFSTSSSAFTGTTTIDLSSFLAQLPVTGTMGEIYSGYSRNPGVPIGMWEVVPEPSSLAQLILGGFALSGILAWRTRRSSTRR